MQASVANPAIGLHDEQVAAQHLVGLLTREQAYLIDADLPALTAITEEKAMAVATMTSLATQRHRALAACGHDASEAGMRAWVNSATANAQAGQVWADLISIAQAAKELNRTNGMLISTHMIRNQTAINVLHGTAQGPAGNFYGPDGQSTGRSIGRGVVIG